jgi:hypothetical protein
MGLLIWLGAYFQAHELGHISCPLGNLWRPFWVDLGVPKWPPLKQKQQKKSFLVVLDHFSLKNGPTDLIRGLVLSLDIGPYIPPTCEPLGTFLD